MKIGSNVFVHNDKIPFEYTCDGESKPVPIKISEVPEGAKSLALIMDDPDAPSGDFVHWVVWNIPPATTFILNGEFPAGTIEGLNSADKKGWYPPCPPSGIHHYHFKLFALDTILSLPESSIKTDLLNAMSGHILDSSLLTGLYERK